MPVRVRPSTVRMRTFSVGKWGQHGVWGRGDRVGRDALFM